MSAAVPLSGADRRLLHPAVPGAFFGFAVLAHIAAWALLGWAASDVAQGAGGPGPALAALHALTAGVLLPTAVGAVLQILPVTTIQSAPHPFVGLTIFALLAAGALALVIGFATFSTGTIQGGTILSSGALGLFATAVARMAWRGRGAGLKDTLPAVWVALGALVAFGVLALLLAADYSRAVLPDHAATAAGHGVLAVFGFMGILVLGFSHILVPMMGVAEPPPPGSGRPALVLAALGVAAAVAGTLLASLWLTFAGTVLGTTAAALHVRLMVRTLKGRLRRRLGPEFHLIRLSWSLLLLALLLALGITSGIMPEALRPLLALLALHGWLLSLLTGILQRIVPFLASMHTVRACARPAVVNHLVWAAPLRVHLVAHVAALALAAAGIVAASPFLLQAAAATGILGAAAFAAFAATVAWRTRRHARTVGPKPEPVPCS